MSQVLDLAGTYGTEASTPVQQVALSAAHSQLGVAYEWGGEAPGTAFDCSGLAQWAFSSAGVSLPRVAQDQFDAGPALPTGQSLVPGDLVFFGTSTSDITHVGIYAGDNEMIDAPNTGSVVRLDTFNPTPGALWGNDDYIGATTPGGST